MVRKFWNWDPAFGGMELAQQPKEREVSLKENFLPPTAGYFSQFTNLNRHFIVNLILVVTFLLAASVSFAQEAKVLLSPIDSTPVVITKSAITKKDTVAKKHSPRIAAIRSAILPGLGQIYNKKYWKLPIVYAALGITGYIFVDNIKTYKEYRFAYAARLKAASSPPDSTDYKTLKNIYKVISPTSIQAARNKFRQYVDYSALFFIIFWGLNVVDATVDAHLKSFDVSPDLSLQVIPGHSQMAGTNGISLVLNIGKK